MPARLLSRLGARTVVLGLALAAGLVAPTLQPAPAEAAGCSGSGGVTVVVDYQGLGGGVEQGCAAGGGGTAYALFQAVGTRMTEASRERGFVCRVNGVPASDPCVNASPADAYWGLFVSDGSGSWSYASSGARALQVPDGGMVAWSWQGGGGQKPPGVSARRTTPAPEAGSGGSGGSGSGGGRGGNGGGGAAAPEAPTTTPTDEPTTAPDDEESTSGAGREKRTDRDDRRGDGDRDRPRRAAGDRDDETGDTQRESSSSSLSDADGETRADDAEAAQATGDPGEPDGLPLWVPLVVVGLLGVGGVGAALWRRRTTGAA